MPGGAGWTLTIIMAAATGIIIAIIIAGGKDDGIEYEPAVSVVEIVWYSTDAAEPNIRT